MNYQNYPNLPVLTAMHASCSIPFIFPPIKIDDDYLVDGNTKSIDGIFENDLDNNNNNIIIKGKFDCIKINSFLNYLTEVLSCLQNANIEQNTQNITKCEILIDFGTTQDKYDYQNLRSSDKIEYYYYGLNQCKFQMKQLTNSKLEAS